MRSMTIGALAALGTVTTLMAQTTPPCAQHARDCPIPPIVRVGAPERMPQPAPSDAIVLFDGRDLSLWRAADGKPAQWKLEKGFFQVEKGKGAIRTAQPFGDAQLHIEWATPAPPKGLDQDRGNSGVFLMGLYELQVLDSYGNDTYPDGQAGSIYGQYPPLVNASRPAGQWQSYDVVFHRPRFGPDGAVQSPATFTVFHNGVLVQDHVSLTGPTAHQRRPPYQAHADKLPLVLQDHEHPVRYRNIWIRELEK